LWGERTWAPRKILDFLQYGISLQFEDYDFAMWLLKSHEICDYVRLHLAGLGGRADFWSPSAHAFHGGLHEMSEKIEDLMLFEDIHFALDR
jgi:hypothetical protein